MTTPPTATEYTTTCLVNNIHCASCVDYVRDVLRLVHGVDNVQTSLLNHEVRVDHRGSPEVATNIVTALMNAAFEVHHATTCDRSGHTVADHSPADSQRWWEQRTPLGALWPSQGRTLWAGTSSRRRETHIRNCESCQKDHSLTKRSKKHQNIFPTNRRGSSRLHLTSCDTTASKSDALPDMGEVLETGNLTESHANAIDKSQESYGGCLTAQQEWIATIGIGGMTCAACTQGITNELKQLDIVKSINVILMTNSAEVVFVGEKDDAHKIIDAIEDVGYAASLEVIRAQEPLSTLNCPPKVSNRFAATLSIEGMTCSACVGAITRGLKELTYITDVVVDLVANSGRVEFEGKENLQAILEETELLGYGVTLVSLDSVDVTAETQTGPFPRTIMIKVDGMFCDHCPENVVRALLAVNRSIIIEKSPTLKEPIATITYTPSTLEFTIRDIVMTIDAAHPAFNSSIFHPPTLEDRSRTMQINEQHRILLRLLFTLIVAIPTFIVGIVFMSLVPKSNSSTVWLEQPLWAGAVTRQDWALFIMTTPVMLFGADVFHLRAAKEIRALWHRGSRVPILRRFYRFGSMNLLISAGTSVAYFASLVVLILNATQTSKPMSGHSSDTYFDSVVFLTLFILIGRYLEAYSRAKTGDAVGMLGKLRPSEATLVINTGTAEGAPVDNEEWKTSGGNTQRVSVDLLEVGDVVLVPHGASPPTDGLVNDSGSYQFDESSLTGESKPVRKGAGDKVFAGSVNIGQPMSVKVTENGGTSMLDHIVSVVRQGQAKRAPVERVADIVTGYFVPVITLVAVLTFVFWFALGQSGVLPHDYLDVQEGGWAFWSVEFAIAVFVVACPCGIGLAAPTALFVGGGLAAKCGILVRGGGEAFQEASRLDAVVFDKTGTLTEGESLKLTDYVVLTDHFEIEYIAWALAEALEVASTHPIAKAIAQYASTKLRANILARDLTEVPGQGMRGTFEVGTSGGLRTYEAVIGNQKLIGTLASNSTNADGYDHKITPMLSDFHRQGQSTAVLSMRCSSDTSSRKAFVHAILFATEDPIRPEAMSVVESLQSSGLDVHMCTGDNETTANAVAARLGIPASNVVAGVLPGGKAEYVRLLQHPETGGKRKTVAFVGDGTNDTPALSAADVSVAMASGSDVAISTASFILLNSDLRTLLQLVQMSKRVFKRVKYNFVWAGLYNLLLIPVAAGVFYPIGSHWRLSPVWASAAMALSSVSVVTSSLALRWTGSWRHSFERLFRLNRSK